MSGPNPSFPTTIAADEVAALLGGQPRFRGYMAIDRDQPMACRAGAEPAAASDKGMTRRRCLAFALALTASSAASASGLPPLAVQPLAPERAPRTFYASPSGDDAHDGASPSRALRTLQAVNALRLVPGDVVSLEGGGKFSGNLVLRDSGTPENPIRLTSHPTAAGDRAVILAGAGNGLLIQNAEHLRVSKLVFTGAGVSANQGYGVVLGHDEGKNEYLRSVHLDEIEASHFRQAGIAMYAAGPISKGFADVRFTRIDAHHNGRAGMWMGCSRGNYPDNPDSYCFEDVYIGQSRFRQNHGIDIPEQTGNGVFLKDVNRGVIEHTLAYENGALNQTPNGPVGIWALYSKSVVIQYNASFRNRTSNGDGGGFDLDGGTVDCVLQYNYSHDNDGPGYLVYQFPDTFRARARGNVVRYNISQNDSRRGRYGAIHIAADGAPQLDTLIYGNTVYLDHHGTNPGNIAAIRLAGRLSGVRVHNNVFITTGGVPLVRLEVDIDGALLQGNAYWASEGPVVFRSHSATHESLAAFRSATGQERLNGAPTGVDIDPRLNAPGTAGTLGDTALLRSLTQYQMRPDSPLKDAGVAVPGFAPGTLDFFGNPAPRGAALDIGAHEAP